MVNTLAMGIVILAGLYFLALGSACLLAPAQAKRFLIGFATSAATHYFELLLRTVAGVAFVVHAPSMRYPSAFAAAGWLLIITTAGLFLLPWQWHHRFAERVVPQMLRFLPLIGIVSLVLAGLVLTSAFLGGNPSVG